MIRKIQIGVATSLSLLILTGCSQLPAPTPSTNASVEASCPLTELKHPNLVPLPAQSIPENVIAPPGQGGLCNARNYEVSKDLIIWRAWNSTYEGSKFGKWWSLEKPLGGVAQYRAEFNICPKYSPLDMLVRCTLKAGTQVVIGPGQSAQCSNYFTYPQSDTDQLYLANAAEVTLNCTNFYDEFSWHEVAPEAETNTTQ
ncbi:hypothetical protein [Pseudoalteromonas rubra]|uniref:hypothetical protein n=1 Tax=Pseudoalteromonas rubra TaxID=43658 RepID=UPI002DB8FEFB|nr:hypothetical protein [Pseudoalteromonas rubra]MEC4088820.1 hypothetical protein [Pseudoalteromonas rubra]